MFSTRFLSRAALAAIALTTSLWGQGGVIHINGQVWDGKGGPFVSGRVYHIISNGGGCCMQVPRGRTLTMQAGAIVKIDSSINVSGTLIARKVIFTSFHDDSVGGDSNNNGRKTSPKRGDWSLIEIGGSALFEDCQILYGGKGSANRMVWHRSGSMTMRRCILEHSASDGLEVSHLDSKISNTNIRRCSGLPINKVALRYVASLIDNTASMCDGGDYLRITHGILDSTPGALLLDHRHSLNKSGVFVLQSTTTVILVRPGATLTIPKGTLLKFERGRVVATRNMQVLGTALEPVVFTSLEDDAFGGDTNKDGNATRPGPGDWSGIQFQAGSAGSLVQNAVVRFGGFPGTEGAGIAIHNVDVTIRDTIVESSRGAGFYFRGVFPNTYPTVMDCKIRNNSTRAAVNIPWQSLAKAQRNLVSGNRGGDYFLCAPERPTVPLTVGPANYPGNVLVLTNGTLLSNGGQLTLLQGTWLKFLNPNGSGFTVSQRGALKFLGTADEPIILTSFADDTVGGDTNQDGNTTQPAAGQWRGVSVADTRVVSDSILENVVIRYAGRLNQDAVDARNPRLTMRSVRVEHVLGHGMDIALVRGNVINPVVWDAARTGIVLNGGSHDIVHATVYGCKGIGIEEVNRGFSGAVRNSIVRNNSGGNFGGTLTAPEVRNTNGGFAGKNGNINKDPRFVNANAGDFHLALGSPCLGTADFGTAVAAAKDHDENSRVLDHALVGSPRPDMGAFERAAYRLKTTGKAILGTRMTFSVEGPAGVSQIIIDLLGVTFYLPPFGVELAGLPFFFLTPGPIPVGRTITVPLPNTPGLAGLSFGVQGLGVPTGKPSIGNMTNVHRETVR